MGPITFCYGLASLYLYFRNFLAENDTGKVLNLASESGIVGYFLSGEFSV